MGNLSLAGLGEQPGVGHAEEQACGFGVDQLGEGGGGPVGGTVALLGGIGDRCRGSEPVHYREWFERVLAAGYATGGKDPAASFLSNVRDSPAVLRADRQGCYRLDAGSLGRVEQELSEAQAELADLEASIARAYREGGETEGLRGHRDELKQRLRRLQSEREELRYVFGEEQSREGQETAVGAGLRAA